MYRTWVWGLVLPSTRVIGKEGQQGGDDRRDLLQALRATKVLHYQNGEPFWNIFRFVYIYGNTHQRTSLEKLFIPKLEHSCQVCQSKFASLPIKVRKSSRHAGRLLLNMVISAIFQKYSAIPLPLYLVVSPVLVDVTTVHNW